jgi:hypothetical protein
VVAGLLFALRPGATMKRLVLALAVLAPPSSCSRFLVLAMSLVLFAAPSANAGPVIASPFSSDYTLVDLGALPGIPSPYGGLTLEAGNPNVLLIGGNANTSRGAIYAIPVTRDVHGNINGFGAATLFASAPYIDGGLAYGPGGVLFYTTFDTNTIGEIKPGSTSPDKIVPLAPLGVDPNGLGVGSLAFVPAGFPSAGAFRIASYWNGQFYDASLHADGSGTYNIASVTADPLAVIHSNTGPDPEGVAYVPQGSKDFASTSLLVSQYRSGIIGTYTADADGNPLASSKVPFITGLNGAEGAFIDPLTGDFLFTTFNGGFNPGGDHFIVVEGFNAPTSTSPVPEPSTLVMWSVMFGTVGLVLWYKRLKKATATA